MSIRTARNSRRFIAAAAAVAIAASTFIATSAGPAGATNTPAAPGAERLDGADRFATAAKVATEEFKTATNVIVVNGRNFPDGIAAVALSRGASPILLVEQDSIPASTADAIEALDELTKVTVIGGPSAISAKVLGELADSNDGLAVERVSGADRYATAIAVATAASTSANAITTAVIATGKNFADALAAGSLVANRNAVILLNNGATLRADVETWLKASNVTAVLVAGGTTAVPAAVMTAVAALKNGNGANISATRLGGDNRFETAVAISASNSAATALQSVVIVNGNSFADALSAAPLALKYGASLLLTKAGSIPAATAAWHVANKNTLTNLFIVGGTSVVSADVAAGALAAATPVGPLLLSAALATSTSAFTATVKLTALGANTVTLSADPSGPFRGILGNGFSLVTSTSATATSVTLTVSTSAGVAGGHLVLVGPNQNAIDGTLLSSLVAPLSAAGFTLSIDPVSASAAVGELNRTAANTTKVGSVSGGINVTPGALTATGKTSGILTLTFNTAVVSTAAWSTTNDYVFLNAGSAGVASGVNLGSHQGFICSASAFTCVLPAVAASSFSFAELTGLSLATNAPEVRVPVGAFAQPGTLSQVPATTVKLTVS